MNEPTPETVLDQAAMDRVRVDVRSVISGERITQRAAADEANIAAATFNAWLNSSYAGNNEKVARDVVKWLEARRQRKSLQARIPLAPAFLLTKSAQRIVEVFQYAQTLHDMGLIIGSPGCSKTSTADYYRASYPAVFMATMEPAKSSTHHLLLELAAVLKLARKSALAISDAVVERLSGRDALLLIDEGQHLQTSAIDQLRTIHDKAKCGVVLLGNETIVNKLGDAVRTPQLAQLYSRFGNRLTLLQPASEDVDALLDEWHVEDRDERTFMRLVAAKPGGLRALTKTMIAATAMATGEEQPRTLAHMRNAWARVGAGPIGNS
jgi:DNA transposition AAA+ family ATPase